MTCNTHFRYSYEYPLPYMALCSIYNIPTFSTYQLNGSNFKKLQKKDLKICFGTNALYFLELK